MKLHCIYCPAYLAIRNSSGKAGMGKGAGVWPHQTRERKFHEFKRLYVRRIIYFLMSFRVLQCPFRRQLPKLEIEKGGAVTC